jgi:hypothetical protein
MAPGKHNASSAILFRLALAPSALIPEEFREDWGRFWAKVRVSKPDACWMWQGAAWASGYGNIWWGDRPEGAHRVAWSLCHGPVPAGLHVLHRCDTPLCVNPGHLFLGNHHHNMQDASRKGRLSVPRPSRRKMTDEEVDEALSLIAAGARQCDIARKYGVTPGFVSQLVSGKARRLHVGRADARRSA